MQYIYYTDGTSNFREGVRTSDSKFVLDKALTPLGFNGELNTDYENIREDE